MVMTQGGIEISLASRGWRPGVQCTGQTSIAKNHPAQKSVVLRVRKPVLDTGEIISE